MAAWQMLLKLVGMELFPTKIMGVVSIHALILFNPH